MNKTDLWDVPNKGKQHRLIPETLSQSATYLLKVFRRWYDGILITCNRVASLLYY